MYHPKIPNTRSSILKFEFKHGVITTIPDSGITEVVYLEIGKGEILNLKKKAFKAS
jgi:hypothetical protein